MIVFISLLMKSSLSETISNLDSKMIVIDSYQS